jgi:hypothetical protein
MSLLRCRSFVQVVVGRESGVSNARALTAGSRARKDASGPRARAPPLPFATNLRDMDEDIAPPVTAGTDREKVGISLVC